ncbi:hypothetical protein [Microbispora bryophytorum]|uniref:Uncharacterized protein n=1 Tax=Microbispora bryophytorum TaxID=1460882 RepID=A0A8H9LH01_9ACTN|nr:hypothetical protein [Microbispora bryophytorum]MBD3137030.1 hypothetical protein [Microbispora bryophytorum]GGO14120.1 hypothetical protein GCM10011574_34190 [Microbispora bryophytorum]
MSGHLARYLETLSRTQHALSYGFHTLRRVHPRESDLCGVCERLAAQCRDHAERLEPFLRRYRSGSLRDPRPAPSRAPGRPPGLEVPRREASGFDAAGFEGAGFEAGAFQAGGFDARGIDAGGFDTGEFDSGRFDAGGRDTGVLDTGGVNTGGFDSGSFDSGGFDAAGLEPADLQRVVRGAVERERAGAEGAEGADSGTARRPGVTPGRGGGNGGRGGGRDGGGDGSGLALLRDLHGLYLLGTECDLSWSVVAQAARGLRDDDLLGLARHCAPETAIQLLWLRTRMHQVAPQVLVVPSW